MINNKIYMYFKKFNFIHGNCPACGYNIRFLILRLFLNVIFFRSRLLQYRCPNCKSLISRTNDLISFIIAQIFFIYLMVQEEEYNLFFYINFKSYSETLFVIFLVLFAFLQMFIVFILFFGIMGRYYLKSNTLVGSSEKNKILSYFKNDDLWFEDPNVIAKNILNIVEQINLDDDSSIWLIVENKLHQFYNKNEAQKVLENITNSYLKLLK